MWNFGLPYKLKQLIDLVAPRNYLFAYDGKQYGPLLEREYSVSRDNDLLGGMWAVMATIFVFRYRILQSGRAAISRTLATFLSFALCFLYFLIFPFNVFGMVALIWIGTVILCLIGHSEAIVTTAITTAVAFVVAGISPGPAWIQPILRLADSAVGIVSGFLLHGWELPFSVGKENGTDLSDLRQTLFTIER